MKLQPGTFEPVYKVLDGVVDPLALFDRLHREPHSFLLESADTLARSGNLSTGCVNPCLKIWAQDNQFEITALNRTGTGYIANLAEDFPFADDLIITENSLRGQLRSASRTQDEESRLLESGIFDVLRVLAFKLKPTVPLQIPWGGLFGTISYDAIDNFEPLPELVRKRVPDLEFYFANELFVIDHVQQKSYLLANLPVFPTTGEEDYYRCQETIRTYEQAWRETGVYPLPPAPAAGPLRCSISDDDYGEQVRKLKAHIGCGDIFQCVLSRTFQVDIDAKPLEIYARLKEISPGPYMFFFENDSHTLLGSSPETSVQVRSGSQPTVMVKPIAGTLPRGANAEEDSRLELELLRDKKELAEHCMLVDLARNDIARISRPGTRVTPSLLQVEKYSHVQHIVSCVEGQLRPELDALHAYRATMNMGTLTGAPKIKAMELLRRYEGDSRGAYGGALCYLTPAGDFDSCIIIRAIEMAENQAEVRSGAGIVYDSDPQREADETRRKAQACLEALGVAE